MNIEQQNYQLTARSFSNFQFFICPLKVFFGNKVVKSIKHYVKVYLHLIRQWYANRLQLLFFYINYKFRQKVLKVLVKSTQNPTLAAVVVEEFLFINRKQLAQNVDTLVLKSDLVSNIINALI